MLRLVVLVVSVWCSVLAGAARAQCDQQWASEFAYPGADGAVNAFATWDDGRGEALYVAGAFTSVGGVEARYLARWDGQRFEEVGGGLDSWVTSLGVHDDGSGPALYVGGWFSHAGGVAAERIARWDGANWTPLGAGLGGYPFTTSNALPVTSMVTFDDGSGPALYVGGWFQSAGGLPLRGVARWNGAWSAVGGSDAPQVTELLVHDDGAGPKLYAAGEFVGIGGVLAKHVAVLNGAQWQELGGGVHSGGFAAAYALASYDDGSGPALWVGGDFEIAGSTSVHNVARWQNGAWSAPGGTTTFTSPVVDFDVCDLGHGVGTRLCAGGSGIQYWKNGAWTKLSGKAPTRMHAIVDTTGPAIAIASSQPFVTFGDEPPFDQLGCWRPDQGWQPFTRGLRAAARALARVNAPDAPTPAVAAAGTFHKTAIPSDSFETMIAHATGWISGPVPTLAYGITAETAITALLWYPGGSGGPPSLVFGGAFQTSIPGTLGAPVLRNIGMYDGDELHELSNGFDRPVRALEVYEFPQGGGPLVIAGGDFGVSGGTPVAHVAGWNGAWFQLGDGLDDTVLALASYVDAQGRELVAGGEFGASGSTQLEHVARFDGVAWQPLGEGLDGTVRALVVRGAGASAEIFAGGEFAHSGAQPLAHVARFDGASWQPLQGGVDGSVLALAVFDDGSGLGAEVYVGGAFASASGLATSGVARWATSSWRGLGGGVSGSFALGGPSGVVRALEALSEGAQGPDLWLGGDFTHVGGKPSSGVARWRKLASSFEIEAFPAQVGVGKPLAVTNLGCGGALHATWIAPKTAAIALPPYGTLGLDPATLVPLHGWSAYAPDGSAEVVYAVPNDPALHGLTLRLQSLAAPSVGPLAFALTNTAKVRVK